MKALFLLAPFFICLHLTAQSGMFANWQYKKHFPDQQNWELLTIKGTDSVVTCMKYYFKSEDTIYFREFPSQRIHKISKNDLREQTIQFGKDYHFARKSQNLKLAALKPKIFLGLSAASLAAVVVDLAQPVPYLGYTPQLAATPLFFMLAYFQAKKMDRYLNYYQMAELQKFSKPEPIREMIISKNTVDQQPKDSTQSNSFQNNNQNVTIVPSQQIPENTNSTSISDEYRYGSSEVVQVKTLSTTSGCQYKLSDYYFQSDGYYYFAIEGQGGTFYMKKDEVARLDGVTEIGKDKQFATERFVLEKARTGKVVGVLYGIGGTFVWGVIFGVATWQVAPAVVGGVGLGAVPAAMIVKKCNSTIRNYKIYKESLKVSCK